jgi:thioredoxin reductase (NADPH)
MYDIIIVGAGPAGLTSAIYACRAKKNVLVLEANTYGGQIVNTSDIENYPVEEHISGFDFATKLYNQTKNLGAEIKFEKVVEIKDGSFKEVITTKDSYKCKAIILATGAENRRLNIVEEADYIGRGISYCATCDGNFYKGKDVAVIGSGKTALEDAIYLSGICNTVYLIHKESELDGDENVLSLIKEKNNINIIHNSSVTKLIADDVLIGIEIKSKDGLKIIDVDGVFVAIGRVPENENFRKIINLNEKGYIISAENCHTNISGIFAAGDNRVKSLRQLVTATNDGAIAAVEAIKYINKEWRDKNV